MDHWNKRRGPNEGQSERERESKINSLDDEAEENLGMWGNRSGGQYSEFSSDEQENIRLLDRERVTAIL
jgi:hypothetical protein